MSGEPLSPDAPTPDTDRVQVSTLGRTWDFSYAKLLTHARAIERQRDEALAKLAVAVARPQIAICAYCGHEGAKNPVAMLAHVQSCDKHPLGRLLNVSEELARQLDEFRGIWSGLFGLIEESASNGWRLVLEYDNYQDGARLLDGDGNLLGECYDSPPGLSEENPMAGEKIADWQFLQAIKKAIAGKAVCGEMVAGPPDDSVLRCEHEWAHWTKNRKICGKCDKLEFVPASLWQANDARLNGKPYAPLGSDDVPEAGSSK